MKQSLIISSDFIKDISILLDKNNCSKILFITGKTYRSYVSESLSFKKYAIKIFSDFDKNTNIKDAVRLSKIIKEFKPDILIAIGGGSVIDISKQANVLANHRKIDSIDELIKNNKLDVSNKYSPLIAIPTTAGTGSEATQFSVVYIDKIKFSIDDERLLPNYIILDSSLIKTMPKELIATTAMDALTQSIESIWAIKSTDESIDYATQAIHLLNENILKAFHDGYNDTIIASNMQFAAYLSGKAINISRTTAAHALSYPITMHHDISHGHAVAITLVKLIEINSSTSKYKINDPRGKKYVDKIMHHIFSLFNCSSHEECTAYFKDLMDSLSLEQDYKKIGIETNVDIEKILNEINLERLSNNPVKLSNKNLRDLFH